MASLSERDITTQFIGKTVLQDNLTKCANKNGACNEPAEYIVYSCGFLYKKDLRELFGITDKLKEQWERRGIDFNVCIHTSEDKIVACRIDKYHESEGARPGYRSLKCTQQELRIAQRILSYIT
jgi:hypothetical protein